MAEKSGEMGGGPRVQTQDTPSKTPLSDSKKGMDGTVEPRTASQGTIGGGQTSSGSKPR